MGIGLCGFAGIFLPSRLAHSAGFKFQYVYKIKVQGSLQGLDAKRPSILELQGYVKNTHTLNLEFEARSTEANPDPPCNMYASWHLTMLQSAWGSVMTIPTNPIPNCGGYPVESPRSACHHKKYISQPHPVFIVV